MATMNLSKKNLLYWLRLEYEYRHQRRGDQKDADSPVARRFIDEALLIDQLSLILKYNALEKRIECLKELLSPIQAVQETDTSKRWHLVDDDGRHLHVGSHAECEEQRVILCWGHVEQCGWPNCVGQEWEEE